MSKHVALLVVLLCLTGGPACSAEPNLVELHWGDLGSRIDGRKVAFVLPDGTRLKGKVQAVEPGGLRMKISGTSNKKVHPKGTHLVAREGISLVRVTEYRKLGRLLVTAGAVGVAGGVIAASDIDIYEGAALVVVPLVAVLGTVGVAVAGYYTGKAIDKRVTDIRILPDGASARP